MKNSDARQKMRTIAASYEKLAQRQQWSGGQT
jgi:hypothetical protein